MNKKCITFTEKTEVEIKTTCFFSFHLYVKTLINIILNPTGIQHNPEGRVHACSREHTVLTNTTAYNL